MKTIKLLSLCILLLFTELQCFSRSNSYSGTIRCDPSYIEINSITGEEFTVTIVSGLAWSATTNQPWVSFSPTSGQGDAFVNVIVSAGEEGVAKILFSNGEGSTTLTITRKAPSGVLTGKFSVSDSIQVQFSQGNLQYKANTDTWRFAEHQYDYVGNDNSFIGSTYYSGWIDLFCWGTGNNPTFHASLSDINPREVEDWGINSISNGGGVPNLWRTLTQPEWLYLFHVRANAENLFGFGSVNGIKGVIVLPDNWETPEGVIFRSAADKGLYWEEGRYKNSNNNNFSHNQYSTLLWEKMEGNGAIFLPAAGSREATTIKDVSSYGEYWSSTMATSRSAYHLLICSSTLGPYYYANCNCGFSVRLVQDYVGSHSRVENTFMDVNREIFIHNGQILILRGEKIYTLQGQEVR